MIHRAAKRPRFVLARLHPVRLRQPILRRAVRTLAVVLFAPRYPQYAQIAGLLRLALGRTGRRHCSAVVRGKERIQDFSTSRWRALHHPSECVAMVTDRKALYDAA